MVQKYLVACVVFHMVLILNAQDLNYAKNIVKILSSEEYGGRGYVNDGDKKAAKFIVKEFVGNDLQFYGNSFSQCFNINVNTFPKDLFFQIGSTKLLPGKDFILDPSSPSLNGKFRLLHLKAAELMKEGKIIDIRKRIRGKVLLLDERNFEPKSKDRDNFLTIIEYLKYHPDVNSEGTIVLTDKKLSWHVASSQANRPVLMVNTSEPLQNLKTAQISINAKLLKDYQTCNLIGYQPGVLYPDSLMLITAHYDHLGSLGADAYFPGANDNASGVAMLLTLMKYFKSNPPKYTMVFIATAAEEAGLLGARHFVENPLVELSDIKFLINFDLAGTGDEGIKVVNAQQYPNLFDRLSAINKKSKYLSAIEPRGEACNSDHCMFHLKGVPCFYIYTLGGISAYHDIYDKYETLPFTGFVGYSNLIIEFIESFWSE